MNDVLIPNYCIEDRNFHDNYKGRLYLLTKLLYWNNRNHEMFLSKSNLWFVGGINDSNRRHRSELMNRFFDLCNYLELLGDWHDVEKDKFVSNKTIVLKFAKIYEYATNDLEDKINYTILKEIDLAKIDCIRDRRKRHNAMNVYCFLLFRSFNKKFCFPSYENICESLGISKNTLSSTLKLLKELEMVIFDNGGIKITKQGDITKHNNVYVIISKCHNTIEAQKILNKEIELRCLK